MIINYTKTSSTGMMQQLIRPVVSVCNVQYASSLFVDKFEKSIGAHFVKPVAPILVLNGNIGQACNIQTFNFIRHCSRNWSTVLYIPGKYELESMYNEEQIYYMKMKFKSFENVHVLHNEAFHSSDSNTIFLGSIDNVHWLANTIGNYRYYYPSMKIVALTYYMPDKAMIHPVDRSAADLETDIYRLNNLNVANYLPVDAWICGYTRGANVQTLENGVVCAYNARGAIDGINDFDQKLGWCRSAKLELT
jgi:hypothetical protein